jgi:hypothetical protein
VAEFNGVSSWHYGAFAAVLPTRAVAVHTLGKVENARMRVWVRDDASAEMRARVPGFRVMSSMHFVDLGYLVFYQSRDGIAPPVGPDGIRVEWFQPGTYVQPRGFVLQTEVRGVDETNRPRLVNRSRSRGCHVCGSCVGLKMCAKCKQVYYCSRECQRSDWRRHKAGECVAPVE